MHTPSKKVIYVLIACIISISLVFFAKDKTPINKLVSLDTTTASSTEDASELNTYLSSIPDTSSSTVTIATTSKLTPEPKTLTNTFVKDFFGKYLTTQSGGAIDDQSKESLVTSIVDQYSASTVIPDHFTEVNITTVSSLDNDKIREYANSFVTIEEQGIREAENFSKLADQNIKNLTYAGSRYKKLATDLGTLEVPGVISKTHLALMNNYYRLGDVLGQMESSTEDSIKVLFLIKQIQESQPERELLYTDIATFIKNSGIIFGNDEPGHFFLLGSN